MGYSYKFADNTVYGAEDINSVISEIATAGVADVFFDGTSYNTSDLNKIAAAIAGKGVKYADSDSCRAVKYSSGHIKVLKGTAFFNDGSLIKIDDEGVVLPYVQGKKNYVYLKGNISAENKNEVCCSVVQGSGDIVKIATIDEDENIIDTREFCKGKIGGYQSGFSQTQKISFSYTLISPDNRYQEFKHDLNGYGYSHIIDISEKEAAMAGEKETMIMSVYDIVNDYYISVGSRSGDLAVIKQSPSGIMIFGNGGKSLPDADIWAKFNIEGTVLTTTLYVTNNAGVSRTYRGNVTLLVV